ncbi:carboxypeptidase-like regulatory domain-containing protein [Actinosynnema sp. NPDC002837]
MDLVLAVVFDKPEFVADEPVTARATVTNVGTAPASRVTIDSTGNVAGERYWEEIGYFGVRVEPGQTVQATYVGRVTTTEYPASMVVTIRSLDEPDANPADNVATISAPVTVVRGTFTGTVYADRNGDATMNAGEALTDLPVEVRGGRPAGLYTTRTDSAGRFTFRDLPRGDYDVLFGTGEVSFPPKTVRVDGVRDPDLLFRGALWVEPVLTASATLDRQTYRMGDIARMTLTLTNSGAVSIPAVLASSWANGGVQVDLGDLDNPGPGVTVPGNATLTIDVPIPIGDAVADYGYLSVECVFGAPPVYNGNVRTTVRAKVLGAVAPRVTGWVAQERFVPRPSVLGGPYTGPAVPGLKVYLKDRDTGSVAARATTNAQGTFEFRDVPAGEYVFDVVGPWKVIFGGTFFIRASAESWRTVIVTPGPDRPEPDVTPPPDVTPAPGEPPAPGAGPARQPTAADLAATGVNVTWLALGGLLTLLIGLGLVVRSGRRQI